MPMDTTHLTAVVSLLIALSIATERLVEIVKGVIPALNRTAATARGEEVRRALVQGLAVGAGMLTAWLARDSVPSDFIRGADSPGGIIVLGLLASGGSGFWNSILTYLLGVKNLKTAEAAAATPAKDKAATL